MTAESGTPPKTLVAALAILTTPAVCEEDGPIITGPIISKIPLFVPIENPTFN